MKESLETRHSGLMAAFSRTDGRSAPKLWVKGAIAGLALSGIVGSSLLAVADGLPYGVQASDSHGNAQKIGSRGAELVKEYEGYSNTGYLLGDGKCTIGIGHAIPLSEKSGTACTSWTITDAEALKYFQEDTAEFADCVNDYFDRSFTQNQFDALVSFTFNVGCAPKKYDWPKNAEDSYFPGVMIQYVNPPQFREGLTRRRNAEIALFKDPSGPESEVVDQPAALMPTDAQVPELVAPMMAPLPAPAVEVPTVVVTQFPEMPHLLSGGLSVR